MASSYQSFTDLGDPPVIAFPSDHQRDGHSSSWRHFTEDLDFFLTKIYRYHQRSGFKCIILDQILGLIQFIFVVIFSIFLLHLVDYQCMTKSASCRLLNQPEVAKVTKITIQDVILPWSSVHLSVFEIILIIFASLFWVIRVIKTIKSVIVNHAIKIFYREALQIQDVTAYTWQDVQSRLIASKHHFLFQEVALNELDVHNRILRHTNFLVALMNKGLLPVHYHVPFLGDVTYFPKGLVININCLIFKGPFAFFETSWKLKSEYKSSANRVELAGKFANHCLLFAILNLALSPFIFFWQILTLFFAYVEVLKRDPNMILGSRNWTHYARWFCRHFNELDHQLDDRLNRGYKSATKYMNSFTNPFTEIVAKHVAFIASSILAVLISLTIYDEDVITVEHILTIMTGMGAVIAVSRAFITDDTNPMKQTQTDLYTQILEHLHYIPYGYAPYSNQARTVMSTLFQYRVVNLLEDLISPIVTPFILVSVLRNKSLEIVDFFRNFTVEKQGTGDVCTFALLNIKENGNSHWKPSSSPASPSSNGNSHWKPSGSPASPSSGPTSSSSDDNLTDEDGIRKHGAESLACTDNGKLELSLIHFKLTNPNWEPSLLSQNKFVKFVTDRAAQNTSIIRESAQNTSIIRESAQNTSIIRESAHEGLISTPVTSTSGESFSSRTKSPLVAGGIMNTSSNQQINPFALNVPLNESLHASSVNEMELFSLSRERCRLLNESINDSRTDSNVAMTLSTLFLHEMATARQQSSSNLSNVTSAGGQQLRSERDPLLQTVVTNYSSSGDQNLPPNSPSMNP